MKNNKYIYFLCSLIFFVSYSCNKGEEVINNNTDPKSFITVDEIRTLIADMPDQTIIDIKTEEDFNNLLIKTANLTEMNLLDRGFEKVDKGEKLGQTRASVQTYSIMRHPHDTRVIEASRFKATFSQAFCNEINTGALQEKKISPNKTYICGWREAIATKDLADNQRAGAIDSPEAALIPSNKSGYKLRGYDAYRQSNNMFIMVSHQLNIVCEDAGGTTLLLDIRYPFWDTSRGYVFNFAILTN